MSTSCALCGATGAVSSMAVVPQDVSVDLCTTCASGVSDGLQDGPHWQFLHEAIWSTEPAVQVLA